MVANRRPFFYIWLTQDLEFLLPYISLQVVGVLFAALWGASPVAIPFLIVPAVTTYVAFETIKRLQSQTQEAMIAMADAIDARDPYTAQHSQRVTDLAVRISEVYGLRAQEIDRVELAARVHDLGKIGISDAILNKAGRLEDHEWELMKAHPAIGEQLLGPYRQFRHESLIVRHHHERWDGRGYPDGVHGNDIPIGSRIIAVADAFDAMTSDRPYRAALSTDYAVDEIRKGALSQFDPQVVASFLHVIDDMQKVTPISRASERGAVQVGVSDDAVVSAAQ
jgi:HD-GYP domain-containing protein (c-di-GMP phosphodiesterase class II)